MDRRQILRYVVLPLAAILGIIGWHRYQRHRELARQAQEKREGLIPVRTTLVENRTFRDAIPFTGTLLAVNRAELKAEVPGRVTRVTVFEGDPVARGAILSAQDEEDLQLAVQAAEAQLAQAQAQAQQAQRDNDRMQMLLEKRSVTRQAAQQAETYLQASLAAVRAAESNLGLAKSRLHKAQIRAPFEGQLAQRLIQPGEMLNPGQPAFVVVDNRRLEILADLPAEAGTRVQVGMVASFRIADLGAEPIQGKVTQVAPSLLPDGRTLRVRIEVPNPGGHLKSGFFASGEILAHTTVQRPSLPTSALSLQGREAELYVVEGDRARRRRVRVGGDQEGWRPVEGLPIGTRVVTEGRDLVVDGSRLRILDGKGN